MEHKKIRAIGTIVIVVIWVALVGFSWFGPAKDISTAERRPLKQWPGITWENVLGGKFMKDFESYSLDQFPLRDTFRELKSLYHYYVMQYSDNNDIYIADGYAAKQEYPLNPVGLEHALKRFNHLYEKYLKEQGSQVVTAVIPDKGYYLAEANGYLAMDYETLFKTVQQQMPWSEHVDLTDLLSIEDYYYTDTHWRQENLLPVAGALSEALGVTPPEATDFTKVKLEKPFYGVYYGQAALPMSGEDMYLLESELLGDCTVFNYENNATTDVYDMDKLDGLDMYEVYLSGSISLLTITNPNAATDKELIIFRDSFGSSVAPLLVQDYKTVTLVDIRYIFSDMLDKHIDFHGQDVLFLYSTLVLNNGTTLK